MAANKRKKLGQYIVADPEICHGQLTFKGTRILVRSVLMYLALGKDWDWIAEAYAGKVSHAAIAEAVNLAGTLYSGFRLRDSSYGESSQP